MALAQAAMTQPPCEDGWVRVRYYVIRNTYDELVRTTKTTCATVFSEKDFGPFAGSRPITRTLRIGNMLIELIFVSIDEEADLRKLLSVDCSGVYLNEFRELPRKLVDELDTIIGRYPTKKMVPNVGCARPMVIMDTNPPNETHWWSMLSGQVPIPPETPVEVRATLEKPPTWEIFIQPPAMLPVVDPEGKTTGYVLNPKAENLKWLPSGYYENMIHSKTAAFIAVNVLNKPGSDQQGKAVWPQFRRDFHVAKEILRPVPGLPIMVGLDFGRTPAAIMGQRVLNRWLILGELIGHNTGARAFARLLKSELATRFPGHSFALWGDPAGEHMAEADDISPFSMFKAEGLHVVRAPTNDPLVRTEAVRELLLQVIDGGKPRFLASPNCLSLIAAMEGGYHFRKIGRSGGDDRYSDIPEKNSYSHPADAAQYLVMGAGEGRAVLGRSPDSNTRPTQARRPRGSIFQRRHG